MNRLYALLLVFLMLVACDSAPPVPAAPDDGITVSEPAEEPRDTANPEPIKDDASDPEPNRAPNARISKTLLEPGGTSFNFVASASDPDGDTLSYVWTFSDGASFQGPSVTRSFTPGSQIGVILTVSDGQTQVRFGESVRLRPAESEAIALLAFSGRCGHPGCGAPLWNTRYLDEKGTTLSVAYALKDVVAGGTVRYATAAAVVSKQRSKHSAMGYYEMQGLLDDIVDTSIRGFDNPTRLVLLGHSHGTVWMSLLAYENPEVTFDYAIYLDGVCNSWERDNLTNGIHGNIILNFYRSIGQPYPQTLQGGVCSGGTVGASRTLHLKDEVPWNIVRGIEARTSPTGINPGDSTTFEPQGKCFLGDIFTVGDATQNFRPDYGHRGLYITEHVVQNHCEVIDPRGDVVQNINTFLRNTGLPNQ